MASLNSIKMFLKNITYLKIIYVIFRTLNQQYGLNLKWLYGWADFLSFWKEYNKYQQSNSNTNFEVDQKYWLPCLTDRTTYTPLNAVYFLQDTWAANKIFQLKPNHHYDIGSSVKSIGIISQFVPVTMVDIRPIDIELTNLFFKQGSILNLPFQDNSIESLSSLCVIEHIGLGRYGDPIDPWGSEKAIREIKRVVKPEGTLLISLPVDEKNKIYFNAHRAFTREYIVKLFDGFELVEEKYQYKRKLYDNYDKDKKFGTGLYMFKKRH